MEDNKNNTFKGSLEGYFKIVQELLPVSKQVTIWHDGYEINPKGMEAQVNLTKSESLSNLKDGVYRMNFFKVGDPS